MALFSSSFHPTTFPHIPPKYALKACFSLYLHVPPSTKDFGDSLWWPLLFCWNHMVLPAWHPGITLHCPSDEVLPFYKFQQLKRVIQQNSLQASSDLVISILCQCFPFFLGEFPWCHCPVKLCLNYFMGMMMSSIEWCIKIALVAVWSEKFGVLTSNILNEKRMEEAIRVVPRNFTLLFLGIDFEKLKL